LVVLSTTLDVLGGIIGVHLFRQTLTYPKKNNKGENTLTYPIFIFKIVILKTIINFQKNMQSLN